VLKFQVVAQKMAHNFRGYFLLHRLYLFILICFSLSVLWHCWTMERVIWRVKRLW